MVRFLSVFAISFVDACNVHAAWFNVYSIVKLFSFSSAFVESFSGLAGILVNLGCNSKIT